MASGIVMSYESMDLICNELTTVVGKLVEDKAEMMTKVNSLCESWNSLASEKHQDEFATVGTSIDNLTNMADELISSVKKYRADMEALDQSYS